jgi:hypothetical protein
MQLHWGWAVIGALAMGTGLAWWTHPADEHAERNDGDAHHAQSGSQASPRLYRWTDAGGVVNISDHPPVGRRYTIVRIDPNRNIVPMSGADSASKTNAKLAPPPR